MGSLRSTVRDKLADSRLQAALAKSLATVRAKSERMVRDFADLEEARTTAAALKRKHVSLLRENLLLFEERLKSAGTEVLWADRALDVRRIVADIGKEHGVRRVVLSKTMAGEEVELEHALKSAGMSVVQTDLGERVVQLAGEKPSHVTAPCLHMSAAQVGEVLHREGGLEYSDDPEKLSRTVARALRPRFFEAGMGITGANVAVADSGAIISVENEGNVRLGQTLPTVHIVICGIEKVVHTLTEARHLLALLPRMATGQAATSYVDVLAPVPLPGQRRYVILLDNGRTALFNSGPFRALLRCIKCGSCMNNCPVYERVGGHTYGWTYPGPVGIAMAGHMAPPEVAGETLSLCTLCGACTQACPVKIPLDKLIILGRHRALAFRPKGEVATERKAVRRFRAAFKGRVRYRLSHWGHKRAVAWFPRRLAALQSGLGWDGQRGSPVPAEMLFSTWFKRRKRGEV